MKKGTLLLLLTLLILFGGFLGLARGEEALDLTADCTFTVSSGKGRLARIRDGDYRSYWQSGEGRNPYVEILSEQAVYGLYLCFERMPEDYELQTQNEEGEWVPLLPGEKRFHHVFYALEGVNSLRVYTLGDEKTVLGFNEIFVFGPGEIPDWVQRWEPTEEKADILFLAAHPDDELLFFGGAIPTYAVERKNRVVVAYLSYSNTTRRSEALNGLWSMGVRNYPVFGGYRDAYSRELQDAYEDIKKGGSKGGAGKNEIWSWLTGVYRQYKPEVVVTHDLDGEYGHGQHMMMADSAIECYTKAADAAEFPESAAEFGVWQVKKLYIHLYGDESNQTRFDWNQPLSALGGRTGLQAAIDAYALHVTQVKAGIKIHGVKHVFSVEETGGELFPNTVFGLYESQVGPDTAHDDFLENILLTEETAAEQRTEVEEEAGQEAELLMKPVPAATAETGNEAESGMTPEEQTGTPQENQEGMDSVPETEALSGVETQTGAASERETEREQETGAENGSVPETDGRTAAEPGSNPEKTDPREKIDFPVHFENVTAPDWADVQLNSRGFLDEGEYVLEDEENGHYMFVNQTIRVVIERSYEELQVVLDGKKKNTHFYAFTANIWCDTAAGELPTVVFVNPEKPKSDHQAIKITARENQVVFATSTDYYTYRIHQTYATGIEVRNGEIFYDEAYINPPKMPNYETIALYPDGHAESYASTEKSAQEYIDDGAYEVFSFGPCLVKDGEITEYVQTANDALNPRYALGVAEPGHYVALLCEGRVKRSNGAQMATLAQMMKDRGCQLAVNLDGGQTAVFAFMGKQINQVVKSDPNGRPQAEILAFGRSGQIGAE